MESGVMDPPLASVPDPTEGEEPGVSLEGEDDEQVDSRERIVIEGDGQLTLAVGGKNPTQSKILVRGGQIPFEGQLKKGEYVDVVLHLRCAEVHLIDKIDSKTGDVVDVTRKHVLKVEGARKVEAE